MIPRYAVTGAFGYSVIGLMLGHLASDAPATGTIKLTEWARRNADTLGRRYASELHRRRNLLVSYDCL